MLRGRSDLTWGKDPNAHEIEVIHLFGCSERRNDGNAHGRSRMLSRFSVVPNQSRA